MTDVKAGDSAAAAGQPLVTVDPANGDLVGGLAGLRELIRAKQSQDKANDSAAKADAGVTNTTVAPVPNAISEQNGGENGKDSRNDKSMDSAKLPVKTSDIVYAEMTMADDSMRVFASQDDKLFLHVWTTETGRGAAYIQAAKRLLSNQRAFAVIKANGAKLFLNRRAEVQLADDGLVYRNKYKIVCRDKQACDAVAKLLNQGQVESAKPAAKQDKHAVASKADQPKHESKTNELQQGEQPRKEARADQTPVDELTRFADIKTAETEATKADVSPEVMLDKISDMLALAHKAKSGEWTAADSMKVFLAIGQASSEVLKRTMHLSDAVIYATLDELRRMRALGVPAVDGTYPILIDNVDKLGRDAGYTLLSSQDNFCEVVKKETTRGKQLVYDLAELPTLQAADEYVSAVARYCSVTNSAAVAKLFDGDAKIVRVSEVLKAVNGDGAKDDSNLIYVGDYDQFHGYVTKYILAAGWLINGDQVADSVLWAQFAGYGTDGLEADTYRYLLTNLPWISAIYSSDVLTDWADYLDVQKDDPSPLAAEAMRSQLAEHIRREIRHQTNDGKCAPQTEAKR